MQILSLVFILYFIGPATCQSLVENNATSASYESTEMMDTTAKEGSAITEQSPQNIITVVMEATVTSEVMEPISTGAASLDHTTRVVKETETRKTEMETEVVGEQKMKIVGEQKMEIVGEQKMEIVETTHQAIPTTRSTPPPNVTCHHDDLKCNAVLKQSLEAVSNAQICSGLNVTLSCFDMAIRRCTDTETRRDLHNSKLLATQQQVVRCNFCLVDLQRCHELEMISRKRHTCRALWDTLLCYRRAVPMCNIPDMRSRLVSRKEVTEQTYSYHCLVCNKDQKNCDKMYERVGLNINEKDACQIISQSIACYNKGLETCQVEEERRIMITSKTVAEQEHMAQCNACNVQSGKCKELMDGSYTSINVVNVCSKLPAALKCLEKADNVCTSELEVKLSETTKAIVKKQMQMLCDGRMANPIVETTTVKNHKTCLEEANVCNDLASDVPADQIHTKYMCSKLNHSRYCFISVMEKCVTKREENILDTLVLSVDQQYYLHCKKFEEEPSQGGTPQLKMGLLEQDVRKLGANAATRQCIVPDWIKSVFCIWTFSLLRI